MVDLAIQLSDFLVYQAETSKSRASGPLLGYKTDYLIKRGS